MEKGVVQNRKVVNRQVVDGKVVKKKLISRIVQHRALYFLLLPVVAYFVIFHYWPMYGVQIAFKNFSPIKGITGSDWVGLLHFERFFDSYFFSRLFFNTLGISLYELAVGFPIPIILALMLNEVRSSKFKRTVQTVTYAPHFLSTVVLVGMLVTFLSPTAGIVNHFLSWFGVEPISFMTEPSWFKTLYVGSNIWQNAGWGAIIYIAALANIDPQMHEAAMMDGASRLQRIWHINIPALMPTITILFILNIGSMMGVGFEKVFLMQNDLNMEASDVFSTYVYRSGILGAQYSFASAVGLFNSLINLILLYSVNFATRRISGNSLW
ncbi:ABC transporter permease [Bacillus sp. SD088]|uniref:ABC transporter permease n=1 Tax=Bacillus sp. SD088 TaxID=2782012 RepID=UPI001A96631A|nr:ABC transporter permease subunit [Bacillus sp. SD088]MBO0995855.1 sugar ABC transporter permease [Bacillus sp. SD088]